MLFRSMGVTARSSVIFGEESLIGVGSNVLKDVEPFSTCYGNPAKAVSFHKETGVVIKEC